MVPEPELDGGGVVVVSMETGFARPRRSVAGVFVVLGVVSTVGLGLASCLLGSETDGEGVSISLFLFCVALAFSIAAFFSS